MKKQSPVFVGIDASMLHSAIVALDLNGDEPVMIRYTSKTKKNVLKGYGGTHLPVGQKIYKVTREGYRMHVLEMNRQFLRSVIIQLGFAGYNVFRVGIEDYAFSKSGQNFSIGELGGMYRFTLWNAGIPFREHHPTDIKMFACKGNADKDEVVQAIRDNGWWNIDAWNKRLADETKWDICDAYVPAKIVKTEWELLKGIISQRDLPENQQQLMMRTTKTYPINLLGRPYAVKPGNPRNPT